MARNMLICKDTVYLPAETQDESKFDWNVLQMSTRDGKLEQRWSCLMTVQQVGMNLRFNFSEAAGRGWMSCNSRGFSKDVELVVIDVAVEVETVTAKREHVEKEQERTK